MVCWFTATKTILSICVLSIHSSKKEKCLRNEFWFYGGTTANGAMFVLQVTEGLWTFTENQSIEFDAKLRKDIMFSAV